MIRSALKRALGLVKTTHLKPGDPAPPLNVADQTGRVWKLGDLRERPTVLYFYPKDDTPGCTKEACAFRDAYASLGATVLGVSMDAAPSHQAFIQKFNLPFPLLADTEGHLTQRWGVLGGSSPRRATFVIDTSGRVTHVFDPVKVEGHAEEVRAALGQLRG